MHHPSRPQRVIADVPPFSVATSATNPGLNNAHTCGQLEHGCLRGHSEAAQGIVHHFQVNIITTVFHRKDLDMCCFQQMSV